MRESRGENRGDNPNWASTGGRAGGRTQMMSEGDEIATIRLSGARARGASCRKRAVTTTLLAPYTETLSRCNHDEDHPPPPPPSYPNNEASQNVEQRESLCLTALPLFH